MRRLGDHHIHRDVMLLHGYALHELEIISDTDFGRLGR